ncbi:MAG TPA: VCBS repeat-containing protein [Planctomycetota bacterium]|nr:VCBS repeat-containing protein [Planctomycetota bacterium]
MPSPSLVAALHRSPGFAAVQRLALVAALAAGGSPAQLELLTLRGAAGSNARFGSSIAGLPVVGSRAAVDLLVGAPYDLAAIGPAGAATAYPSVGGPATWSLLGGEPGAQMGNRVAVVGDVDGDGISDALVCAHGEYGTGAVVLLSGRTGRPILRLADVFTSSAWRGTGLLVAAAGDVDRDGVADFMTQDLHNGRYTLWVISGAQARVNASPPELGSFPDANYVAAAVLGDTDGDGYPDLAAATDAGIVVVLSGRTFTPLHVDVGSTVCAAGDVDGDGYGDLAIGRTGGAGSGEIEVLSGRTWSSLFRVIAPDGSPTFGASIAGGSDIDGDGTPDLLVGDPGAPTAPGQVWVLSGLGGAPVYRLAGERPGDRFGSALGFLGDLDFDGRSDFAIGAPGADGYVRIYAGAPRAAWADTGFLTAAGGSQHLRLTLGPGHAGAPFLVIGTLSGTNPGVNVAGLHLALNPDSYTQFTALGTLPPQIFSGFRGLLTAAGDAASTLTVSPSIANAARGITAHHVFVVLNAGSLQFASEPLSLQILP